MHRRWHGVEVLVFPTRVQGQGAAKEIAEGIRLANRLKPSLDVLVACRGGGSLEDLWCFNEEKVVRAIAASRLPVVSAVGHEIDVTLADLVADVRALTPSEAAERVVPSSQDVNELMNGYRTRLQNALVGQAATLRNRLDAIASRPVFARPLELIHQRSRQVDERATRLHNRMGASLQDYQGQLTALSGKLHALSPLGVLSRGYSLTQDHRTGRLITSTKKLKPGVKITTRFDVGSAISTIDKIE